MTPASGASPSGPACGACGAAWPEGRTDFRAVCKGCGAWLHACRNCLHYDAGAHHECRAAATAEYVPDKEKFNFCEEFAPNPSPRRGGSAPKTRAEIEKLFPGLG